MSIPFWDTVVVNAAPIIIALTGFGAMLGGFYMQYRMMNKQNEKIEQHAAEAATARQQIIAAVAPESTVAKAVDDFDKTLNP